jgi:tetratricopeptide (TPR) repeat protein
MFYVDRQDKARAASSDALIAALSNERGDVIAEGAPPSPMQAQLKETDPRPSFGTHAARADAALAAYEKVTAEHPSSGAAILARLGKAGIHLDRGEADAALSGFNEVLTTELAKADLDVRARATEGKAFALEAKKDHDGALNAFRELEGMDKSFEDLAKYHQARIHFRKGEKDRAKELLVALYKKLEVPPPTARPRSVSSGERRAVPARRRSSGAAEEEAAREPLRGGPPADRRGDQRLDPGADEAAGRRARRRPRRGARRMPTPPMPAPMPQAPAPGGDDDGTALTGGAS